MKDIYNRQVSIQKLGRIQPVPQDLAMNNNDDDNADAESSNDQISPSLLESLIRAGSNNDAAAIVRSRGSYRRNVVDV